MKKRDFITEDLISKIYQHQFKDNRLPTQRELASRYGVSRYTIQKSLERLKRIGMIHTIQGDGIYIRDRIHKYPLIYNSVTETPYQDIRSRLVYLKRIPAEPEAQRAFELSPGDPVWEFQRIRIIKYQLSQLETSVMPCALFPDISKEDLEGSVQKYVQRCGLRLSHSITNYHASAVNREQAKLLNCRKGTPAMEITNRGTLTDGRIYVYSKIIALDYSCTYVVPFNKAGHEERHRNHETGPAGRKQ